MVQHSLAKIEAWISVGATLLVAAAQTIRFVQQTVRLQERWDAQRAGYLAAYDAEYTRSAFFLPSTDVPLHDGATVFTPLWTLFQVLLLIVTALSEIPGTKAIVERTRRLAPIWGPNCGVGPVGALQILLALNVLGTVIIYPDGPAILGIYDPIVRDFRYIAALILLAIGALNVLLGMLRKKQWRVMRGQAKPPGEDDKPKDDGGKKKATVKEKWLSLKAVLGTMYASVAVGPYAQRVGDLEEAIGAL